MYTTLTLTSVHWHRSFPVVVVVFSSFSLFVRRQTQLSCTIHSLTSVHAHLDRTGLESIVFSETGAVILSSWNHTLLRSQWNADSRRRDRIPTMADPLDAELLEDLRGLGKPPSFDGNDAESRLSLQLLNPHEPRQCGLSHVDGQLRNWAESDLPGSSDGAWRCTLEVLHTDVLFTGVEDERQCPNPCPICWGIRWSRGMASDTQQICARRSESTIRFDAEDHDACETLVWPRWRFWIRIERLGAGCRRMEKRFWNCVGRCSQSTQWWWQCRSSNSFVAMVLLFPELCSESDCVSWKWNERRWWPYASRLSQERQAEGQRQTPQLERKSHDEHDQHELYRHQHVPELWQKWTLGEGLLETRWRSIRQFHR